MSNEVTIGNYTYNEVIRRITELEKFIKDYDRERENFQLFVSNQKKDLDKQELEIYNKHEKIQIIKNDIIKLKKQYSEGFPLLAKAYSDYEKIGDSEVETWLIHKKRPAPSARDTVIIANKAKREAIRNAKETEYLLSYLESLYPFISEAKGQLIDELEAKDLLVEYSEEEKEDRVTQYVSKTEYRKLSTVERNQLALDRYWDRRKSKKGIGNLYERYVGYLMELEGYKVTYTGISKGLEDLGRDLIAEKDNEVLVIQCKYWAEFKTLYENHIFQFFGTVFQYKYENPLKEVRALFYTKTKFSELASTFAKELNIEVYENFRLTRYPCIKCNIAMDSKEKIYHLPFDQQYDRTVIEPEKGEFYTMTVEEAEQKGFRRAYRWKGESK